MGPFTVYCTGALKVPLGVKAHPPCCRIPCMHITVAKGLKKVDAAATSLVDDLHGSRSPLCCLYIFTHEPSTVQLSPNLSSFVFKRNYIFATLKTGSRELRKHQKTFCVPMKPQTRKSIIQPPRPLDLVDLGPQATLYSGGSYPFQEL